MGGSTQVSQRESYWDRFEIVDDLDGDTEMNFDDFGDDSDDADDIDMKELENQANQGNPTYQNEAYNQHVINDEIEDYDSDEENDKIVAIEK